MRVVSKIILNLSFPYPPKQNSIKFGKKKKIDNIDILFYHKIRTVILSRNYGDIGGVLNFYIVFPSFLNTQPVKHFLG